MSNSLAKRRSYRNRTARSLCRKKTSKKCLKVKGCKMTRKTAKRKSYCRKSRKHMVRGGGEEYMSKGGAPATLTITENTGTDPLSTVPTDIVEYVNDYIDYIDTNHLVKSTIIPIDENSRYFISSLVDGFTNPPEDGFKITYQNSIPQSNPEVFVLHYPTSAQKLVSGTFGSNGLSVGYIEYMLVFKWDIYSHKICIFRIVKKYKLLSLNDEGEIVLCMIRMRKELNDLPISGTFTLYS